MSKTILYVPVVLCVLLPSEVANEYFAVFEANTLRVWRFHANYLFTSIVYRTLATSQKSERK